MSIVKVIRRSSPLRSRQRTAALASAACLLAVGAASAAAAMVTQQVRVSYQDLNLSTPAGAQALYVRIERAAHQVCAYSDLADLNQAKAVLQCEHHALEHAVSDVHSPRLTALYNSRNKDHIELTAMSAQ